MTRRQAIPPGFNFNDGFLDSVNPLTGGSTSWAPGSANQVLLGNNLIRPMKGFLSKGTDSGLTVSLQLGASYGGLQNYSPGVVGQGSVVKDFLNYLYTVGAGQVMYEASKVEIASSTFNLVSNTDINTSTDVITKTAHGLVNGQAVLISAGTTLPTVSGTALTSTTSYYVANKTTNTFQLAYTYTSAVAGTPVIDFTSQGVGTITFSVGSDFRASSVLQVAEIQVNPNWYSYSDDAGLDIPDTPTIAVPTTPGTGYNGVINGAISFKIGAMRDRTQAGQNITNVNIAVKSVTTAMSAVAVPVNQTVKITFPSAQVGQTHWGVFATKQGFGGTGDAYRVGYRTSDSTDATANPWIFGIPEETIAAATGRTLEFDFQDGDLYPETAWIFDYQAPPGTHFLRLNQCGVVLGCYDGTVCAVSLPNFMESYHPRHLLYLPEPVTAVLHRLSDDYAYVACRNSIQAITYTGYRGDDIPSAQVTTISPEVGIAKQCNWANGSGVIVAFMEGKGLVMIDNYGQVHYEFGKEVAQLTSTWTTDAVVAFNPSTQSFVAGFQDVSVSYSMESKRWSAPVYNEDYGITGNWLSAINSQGEMIASMSNSGVFTAYSYDNNGATTRALIPSVSRWASDTLGARSNNIYELEAAIRAGTNAEPLIMGLHTNLFTTNIRTVAMTSASNVVTASSSIFNDTFSGKQFAVFGLGIGNRIFTANATFHQLTVANHGLVTGQSITVSNSGGGLPSPLTANTTYYVYGTGANTFKLATTLLNSLQGNTIAISTTGTGTNSIVVNFLIGQATYVSPTTCTLTQNLVGGNLNAGASVSGMLCLVGQYFYPVTGATNTDQHMVNCRPAQQNCRSFAISVVQASDANVGAVLACIPFGTQSQSSVINVT